MSALWAIAGECGQLNPSQHLMQLMDGYRHAQIVYVLARLRVPDILAGEPKSVDEVARQIDAHPDALYRLLRAGASLGLLTEIATRTFVLTPLGALLRFNDAGSLRDYALALVGPGHWEPWEHLERVIRSGESACKQALGMDLWDYYRKHPEEGEHFARAMSYRSAKAAEPIVDACDLAGVRKIVDIGGSQGVLLKAFVEAAPQAHGILFDLPHVIAQAEALMSPRNPMDRIELVGGDFFESVPADGDLYLLKSILCDWDDTRCTKILRNIHRAAAPVSRLLILDTVVSETADASQAALVDLNMLVLVDGRKRTEKEFARLLDQAGFRLERIVHTSDRMVSVTEAVKG